jgi:hypothetical protein
MWTTDWRRCRGSDLVLKEGPYFVLIYLVHLSSIWNDIQAVTANLIHCLKLSCCFLRWCEKDSYAPVTIELHKAVDEAVISSSVCAVLCSRLVCQWYFIAVDAVGLSSRPKNGTIAKFQLQFTSTKWARVSVIKFSCKSCEILISE